MQAGRVEWHRDCVMQGPPRRLESWSSCAAFCAPSAQGRRPSLGLSQSAGDLRTVQALDDGVRGSGLAKGHKPRMAR